MKNKLHVVLDTNVLLVSISSKSMYHWLFQGIVTNKFNVSISNDILLEYEEVISDKFNTNVAKNVIRTLLLLPNVSLTEIYFKWHLIHADADDNKFVDCAISAGAQYIVTNDKDFNALFDLEFPKIRVVSIFDFKDMIM